MYRRRDGGLQFLCREQKPLDKRMFIDVIVDGFWIGTLADLVSTL
jgi:hypothetical protein